MMCRSLAVVCDGRAGLPIRSYQGLKRIYEFLLSTRQAKIWSAVPPKLFPVTPCLATWRRVDDSCSDPPPLIPTTCGSPSSLSLTIPPPLPTALPTTQALPGKTRLQASTLGPSPSLLLLNVGGSATVRHGLLPCVPSPIQSFYPASSVFLGSFIEDLLPHLPQHLPVISVSFLCLASSPPLPLPPPTQSRSMMTSPSTRLETSTTDAPLALQRAPAQACTPANH